MRNATELRILIDEDMPAILPVMLKTNEPFVRISSGRAAARLTTDRSFGIEEDKITDELLAGFIKRTKLSESKAGASLTEKELAKLSEIRALRQRKFFVDAIELEHLHSKCPHCKTSTR